MTLTTGETRHLAGSQGTAEETSQQLHDFEKGMRSFRRDWLETRDGGLIARAQIVEAETVPVEH